MSLRPVGMTSRDGKALLVVISAHHLSQNIAAQRFRSILRHIDLDRYEVHVLTRSTDNLASTYVEPNGITIHSFAGRCVGDRLGAIGTVFVLLSSLLTWLPFLVRSRRTWLGNVTHWLRYSDPPFQPSHGRRIILGTYSPVDALVAAKCLQRVLGGLTILDFRDGFVFESLGRKGNLARVVRSAVERCLVGGASLVTSVSRPLVDDFRRRYPSQRVELLPNGYDPDEAKLLTEAAAAKTETPLERKRQFTLAHFGRIGTSDASRTISLRYLVDVLNRAELRDNFRVLFVGDVNDEEREIVGKLRCEHAVMTSIERKRAMNMMTTVDSLLLITGDGSGCATGKLFEYMVAGPPVVCFSVVRNEAARIIQETGCGGTAVVGDIEAAETLIADLLNGSFQGKRNLQAVARYSRAEQARQLCSWIDELSPRKWA